MLCCGALSCGCELHTNVLLKCGYGDLTPAQDILFKLHCVLQWFLLKYNHFYISLLVLFHGMH